MVRARGTSFRRLGRIVASFAMAGTLVGLAWPRPMQLSVYTLLRPLAPNLPIPGVSGGYVLGDAVPGHEGDLVFMATSGARHIEVHLLDHERWPDAVHTPSFDVAYEGYGTNAPTADCEAVLNTIVAAIRANDPGHLRIDALARHLDVPTGVERVLDGLRGERAVVAGMLMVGLSALLAGAPFGHFALGLLLAALGFWLRATRLDLPFLLDADVQRLFTAHLPLRELVNTATLHDRHPPFMFLLLHAFQGFGQSEAVVRLPAVIAGTLVAPAILTAACWLRQETAPAAPIPTSMAAVCAALVAATSPVLVDRSREVSELTLFGLLAVITVAASLRACAQPTRTARWLVAVGHALLLWTYYLGVFLLLGFWLAMRWTGRIERRTLRAAALGSVAGLPSVAFSVLTLFRDYPLRQTARLFPQVVWGEQPIMVMAREIGYTIVNAAGAPLVAVIAVCVVVAAARRDRMVVAPFAGAAAVAAGMLLLVQPARIQAYYCVSALPLLLLALALFTLPTAPRQQALTAVVVALATAVSVPRLLANAADRIYSPDPSAFGRRFAQVIAARPESRVAVVFTPDSTLLAYSLARAAGTEIDWRDLREQDGVVAVTGLRQRLVPLLQWWTLGSGSEQRAIAALDALAGDGDFLAVAPDPSPIPEIDVWLQGCAELDHTSVRRLLRCSKPR